MDFLSLFIDFVTGIQNLRDRGFREAPAVTGLPPLSRRLGGFFEGHCRHT
jgi:hypothetical protein